MLSYLKYPKYGHLMLRTIGYCFISLAIIPSLSNAYTGHADGSDGSLAGYYLIMLSILIATALTSYAKYKSTSFDQRMSGMLQSQPEIKSIDETSIPQEQNPLNKEAK
jgi:hypothetical protein